MDIEPQLREMLVLEDPGARFTDAVMSRVPDVPAALPSDGVVRLADVRARRRGRRMLLGALVVLGAAASMLPLIPRDSGHVPAIQQAVAALPGAAPAVDPASPLQGQSMSSGSSDGALDCIDPDVLRGLLLQLPNEIFRIGAAAPPELADFKPPRQLTWLGATERSLGDAAQSTVAAVYRAGLAPDAARVAMAGALAAEGWQLRADSLFRTTNVFTAVNLNPAETYCREGKPINLSVNALDGVTYLVLSVTRRVATAAGFVNACDQQPPPVARSGPQLDPYLPKLELPRDPDTGQLVAMLGGGGSGGASSAKRSANVSFMLKGSLDGVARHFARQMAEQGWSSDASWSGATTAGSTWTRRMDSDTLLQGTVMVSAFDGGMFSVVFQMVSTK